MHTKSPAISRASSLPRDEGGDDRHGRHHTAKANEHVVECVRAAAGGRAAEAQVEDAGEDEGERYSAKAARERDEVVVRHIEGEGEGGAHEARAREALAHQPAAVVGARGIGGQRRGEAQLLLEGCRRERVAAVVGKASRDDREVVGRRSGGDQEVIGEVIVR